MCIGTTFIWSLSWDLKKYWLESLPYDESIGTNIVMWNRVCNWIILAL